MNLIQLSANEPLSPENFDVDKCVFGSTYPKHLSSSRCLCSFWLSVQLEHRSPIFPENR